ncbi:heavy metal translocating P-type ATPase [Thermoproteota archaeon]
MSNHNHEYMETNKSFFGDKKETTIIIVSAILLVTGLYFEFISQQEKYAQILFVITTIISGLELAINGLKNLLQNRRISITLLICLAAIGSFYIGHGEEGAAVVFLYYIAEYLEELASERARQSIQALMELAPETAIARRNGEEIKLPVEKIQLNDTILIRPGEKIPLDGVVTFGQSSVNQAPITGESMPVTKKESDEVYAGTINNEGYIEIKVKKRSDETIVARIADMVIQAQLQKSPSEKFIDRFSKYYTPAVILLSIIVATVPPLFFGLDVDTWLYKALTLLVVSCPCALAISVPVSMISGITSGAKNGVLIKGSTYVEDINKIKVYALDKTGTITKGKLKVMDVLPLDASYREILTVAASLESQSEHPIAEAIVMKSKNMGLKLLKISEFTAVIGKGIKGKIDGIYYFVGSPKFFEELGSNYPVKEVERLTSEGKTVIIVGKVDKILGLIAVMDEIREKAKETITILRRKGIRTVMLTGDNFETAKAVALKVGVDHFYAELLPEDKVRLVENLKEKYGNIAMVGDGVNDAPALARADVGIAMGVIGSDVALETADIALLEDSISKLPYMIDLSKKTMSIVKQNILASIIVKGSFVLLTFPGYVTLWLAVAIGDMGLSLAVILNSMRLSRVKADV